MVNNFCTYSKSADTLTCPFAIVDAEDDDATDDTLSTDVAGTFLS